jgi:hypothetical protein
MIEANLEALAVSAKARIEAASTADELEAVRVEVLGRKGALANVSKDMGKLTPEQRAATGKLLNAAKQTLEAAFDARKAAFDAAALAARLDSEWVDLTIPAPSPVAVRSIPSPRFRPKLRICSSPSASPSSMALRSNPTSITSTLSTSQPIIRPATCRIPSGWKAAGSSAPTPRPFRSVACASSARPSA